MDRYHRHKLKEDKFAEVVTTGTHWATEHRKNFIGGGIALLVVVLAVSGFSYRQSNRERESNEQFGKAVLIYSAPIRSAEQPVTPGTESYASISERLKAANRAFTGIADSYPRTAAGKGAAYMVGVTAAEMGDTSKAETSFRRAASQADSDMAALARLALANLYHATNRDGDAIQIYKDLISHPTNSVSKTAAQLQLASVYETSDPSQAQKLYEEIQKADKDAGSQIAQQRLAALKSGSGK